jgi:hypothetical protein
MQRDLADQTVRVLCHPSAEGLVSEQKATVVVFREVMGIAVAQVNRLGDRD